MDQFKRMSPFMMDELQNMDFKKILSNEQMDDRYKTDAFDAFKMHIVKKAEDLKEPETSFDPEYMHHFFDTDEQIVGYMDPEINLYFTPGSMHALLKIEFEDKKAEAEELRKGFDEHFLQGFSEEDEEFLKIVEENKKFVPPGKEIDQFD